jgi:hypothetical protein
MANTQWIDRSHPQTLLMANMLLYLYAIIWVLQTLAFGVSLLALLAVGAVLAGLGIANEKKIGYWGAIAVAALNVLVWLPGAVSSIGILINLVFAIALLFLLLHPMSRHYQKIWFKRLNRDNRRR